MVANRLLPGDGFSIPRTSQCGGILTSMGGVRVTDEPSGIVALVTQ